jgi:hypothetical protein
LQFDESDLSVLSAFAHYVDVDTIQDKMLFCNPFKQRNKGINIFNVTGAYFNEATRYWSHYIGMCTDGVTPMTGQYNAYVAGPKRLAPNISWAGSREKCIPESLSKLWIIKLKL